MASVWFSSSSLLFFFPLHWNTVLFCSPYLPLCLLHLQFSEPVRVVPPLLPSLVLLFQRCWSELLLHFLPSQPVFIPSRSTCVSLWAWQSVAWSSQPQRQAGQLPEVEDGVEEVEEEAGAGAQKNSRYNRGRGGKSVRRRGRWHIWNTISDVLPLNLLRALVSRKRIYACVCGCLPLSVNVCVRVSVRAMCSLWLILQQKPLGGGGRWTRPNKERRGGRYLVLLWLASLTYTQSLTCTHIWTSASISSCTHVFDGEDREEGGYGLSPSFSTTMDCSMCQRLVWALKRFCLHMWRK